jgi:hypothetical protein
MEPQSNQTAEHPNLNLTPEQMLIIHAHARDAVSNICAIRFSAEKSFDQMLANAYEQGRLALAQALSTYDQEMLTAARQQTDSQTQSEGESL